MDDNSFKMEQEEKLHNLKRMRFIATGLLVLMTLSYFILKRLGTQNVFISSAVAFSEAAMIGALADWFAVVALFRHPLGISWIPHTAIIQKNQDKIGESLSNFVVGNFFTSEVLENKLQNVSFAESMAQYFINNREEISAKIAVQIPKTAELFFKSNYLNEFISNDLKSKFKEINLHPTIEKMLVSGIDAELHVPVAKQILASTYKWVIENKEKTLRMIEGMNKSFTLPFVGDIIYNFIVKNLAKLIEDLDAGAATDFNKELLHDLPMNAVMDFKKSKEWEIKIEKLKSDFLDSAAYQELVYEKLNNIEEKIINSIQSSPDLLNARISGIIEILADECMRNDSIRISIDNWIKEAVVNIIAKYRQEIGKLISDTVKEWPLEDMVEKLETQVGGDLQYIRINGTVIGGLAGLVIHTLSLWI